MTATRLEGSAALQVHNPYSGEIVGEFPYDRGISLEAKVDLARKAHEAWRKVPLEQRIKEVGAALEYFQRMHEEVARDVSRQMGKPIREARREVETMVQRAEYMLSIAAKSLAPDVIPAASGFTLRIEHEPLGVVLDIAAWNYPLLIPVNVIVPALVAGDAVLLKHSALTPLCGLHFERAFEALSVPNLVTNLVLSHDDTTRMIQFTRIDYVAFTGSVGGGRSVYRTASQRLIDVGLELGGKDPAYIAEDADLEFAVENVIDGACYNAGQSCCAVERVYVHRNLYKPFLERATQALGQYLLGDPLAEQTTMGPVANRSSLDLFESQIKDAVRRGARLCAGGRRVEGTRGFFQPTLLADCPNDSEIMQEETFGPLVPVAPVSSDAEALMKMNDSRYGLTASVWTTDPLRAERMARELEAGTVYQNRCDYLDPALPWTGVKESGIGSTLSKYGFHHLTRRKSIHFRA